MRFLENSEAKRYIKRLNKDRFAGYSDWRMPTIEELASLLSKDKYNGLHIDASFDSQQKRCWSNDRAETMHGHENATTSWVLDYNYGKARRAHWFNKRAPGWEELYTLLPYNYVRAVHSVK